MAHDAHTLRDDGVFRDDDRHDNGLQAGTTTRMEEKILALYTPPLVHNMQKRTGLNDC